MKALHTMSLGARGAALAVAVIGAAVSCSAPTAEPTNESHAAMLPPGVTNPISQRPVLPIGQNLSAGEVLGIEVALIHGMNLQASLAYDSSDLRVAALTHQIAKVRLVMDEMIESARLELGAFPVDTSTSLRIKADADREFAALSALSGKERDDALVDALILAEARGLGIADHVLWPNVVSDDVLRPTVETARVEMRTQLWAAQKAQAFRRDPRLNATILDPTTPAPLR